MRSEIWLCHIFPWLLRHHSSCLAQGANECKWSVRMTHPFSLLFPSSSFHSKKEVNQLCSIKKISLSSKSQKQYFLVKKYPRKTRQSQSYQTYIKGNPSVLKTLPHHHKNILPFLRTVLTGPFLWRHPGKKVKWKLAGETRHIIKIIFSPRTTHLHAQYQKINRNFSPVQVFTENEELK